MSVIRHAIVGHLREPASKYQSVDWKHIIILDQEI